MPVDALVTPKTTLVILLGASEWPHWPDLNSRTFATSAANSAFNAFQLQTKTAEAFKGIGLPVGTQQTERPKKGSAILCSSSRRGRSDSGERYTKFSGALLHVLRIGVPGEWGRMSLVRVTALVKDFFDQTDSQPPRPEVHAPDQREGNVAKIPFFPNPWAEEAQRTQQAGENYEYNNEFIAFHNQGQQLALLGRYDEALAALEQVILLDPNESSAYHSKGNILNALGRNAEAEAAYAQAKALES